MSQSSFGAHGRIIRNAAQFESEYREKVARLIATQPLLRGPAHATQDETMASTHELMFVTEHIKVPVTRIELAEVMSPNLPWAEDHFQERVGGVPLNPPPAEAYWPFARAGNAEHKNGEKFSHTYPERYWPRFANEGPEKIWHSTRSVDGVPHVGIRFEYGDLGDLIEVLRANNKSRQAYLPVWFPEDIKASRLGERVPCSMGYHFIYCDSCRALDLVYSMRSCDIVRFYRDDMYMTGRLLQLVAHQVGLPAGTMVVNINNLHCFPGDVPYLRNQLTSRVIEPKASRYNFDGML